MARLPRRSGEIIEGPEHRPRERRPHMAQEVAELAKSTQSDNVTEFVRRLLPSVRHRALGCEPHQVPYIAAHVSPAGDRGYYRAR